jgi:hypothetical protein
MKTTGNKLHPELPDSASEYPHTVAAVMRMRENIDSFFELPKDKRPPEDYWFDSEELESWFDKVFKREPTEFEFTISEDEVEG